MRKLVTFALSELPAFAVGNLFIEMKSSLLEMLIRF